MEKFTIGELARRAQVSVETVRYYQRRGLLPLPVRLTGYRQYTEEYVQRIIFIRQIKQLGFTLREVSELLNISENLPCSQASKVASKKLSEIDEKIRSLQKIRSVIKTMIGQCDGKSFKDCSIVKQLTQKEEEK